MSIEPHPSTWRRAQWLEWRRHGIGASDVAALCGMSTFGSPLAVYLDKLGLVDDIDETEAMEWGRLLEPPILRAFADQTDLDVDGEQALAVDDVYPWRRATLDALAFEHADTAEPLGVIEVKTTGDYDWSDGLPDRVALQVQWQLGVTGIADGWVAVLHQGRRFRIYEVQADVGVYDRLTRIVDRFWRDHVLAQQPPPADSNPATKSAIARAYRDPAGEITLDEAAQIAAREWLPAKQLAKFSQEYVDLLENTLRAALADREVGVDDDGTPLVTWKQQTRAGHYVEGATYRVLRPTRVLRERAPKEVTK